MGNWRRVHIKVQIPAEDVDNLQKFLDKYMSDRDKTDDKELVEIPWDDNETFPDYSVSDLPITYQSNSTIKQIPQIEYFDSCGSSLCGIDKWVRENINTIGNIGKSAENSDIVKEWRFIVAKFPKIKGEIYICGHYESKYCVGRVVIDDGKVNWLPPIKEKVKNNDD
jgi:hypothetical protein